MIRSIAKAITFDCAGTLIKVRWTPDRLVAASADWLGVEVPPDVAADFAQMFLAAREPYVAASRTRDPRTLRRFWWDLHASWLVKHALGVEHADAFMLTAEELVYSPESHWFVPYSDVASGLVRLRESGFRLAVISNWDVSLHRILETHGLSGHFETVVASLEEGMEKPAPALFACALERMGVAASEAIHIGDDPREDIEGARAAGMRALRIDRSPAAGEVGDEPVIRTFDELPEALAWSR